MNTHGCMASAALLALLFPAVLSGCGGMGMSGTPNPAGALMSRQAGGQMGSAEEMIGAMTAKMNFSQEMMKNPDLPA